MGYNNKSFNRCVIIFFQRIVVSFEPDVSSFFQWRVVVFSFREMSRRFSFKGLSFYNIGPHVNCRNFHLIRLSFTSHTFMRCFHVDASEVDLCSYSGLLSHKRLLRSTLSSTNIFYFTIDHY